MRIGAVWLANANANYRAIDPLKAMERRGHEVVWPRDPHENPDPRDLLPCDVVHVYRRADDEIRPILWSLVQRGIPYTYDNDDDFASTPKQSPEYKKKGFHEQRYFAATVKVAQTAAAASTTNAVLAEKYRRAGVPGIAVIPNMLAPDVSRPTNRHDGLVIGWIAALEHLADAKEIKIADALTRILEKHDDVRVECIGVNLALPTPGYSHDPSVPFGELPRRIARFDIGIAPLADIPWNRARSDIKVKEYAASGVPWLASPVGPYAGLGEEQGGRLVPADGWFEALDRLVSSRRDRRRLGRKGKSWAKRQTIEAVADRWEHLFTSAARQAAVGAGG